MRWTFLDTRCEHRINLRMSDTSTNCVPPNSGSHLRSCNAPPTLVSNSLPLRCRELCRALYSQTTGGTYRAAPFPPRPSSGRARFRLDESSSSPSEPSPAARERPLFTLLLGLEIGCSIVMSGLVLQKEHRRPPLPIAGGHSRNSSRGCTIDGTDSTVSTVSSQDAAAAVSADGTRRPPTLQPVAPLPLPIATPERRRLAPTEFATPLSPAPAAVTPEGDGDEDGDNGNPLLAVGAPDPVLTKLVRDFDHGGVHIRPSGLSGCSSSSPSCSDSPPPAACGSGSDSVGPENIVVPLPVSATERGSGWSSGVVSFEEGQPATADPVGTAEPATDRRQGEDCVAQRLSINTGRASSAWESGAVGRGGEETRERSEGFRGRDGDGGSSELGGGRASGGGGGSEKSQRVELPKRDQEMDVPDGEWRRFGGGVERVNDWVVLALVECRGGVRRLELLWSLCFCLLPSLRAWVGRRYDYLTLALTTTLAPSLARYALLEKQTKRTQAVSGFASES